MYPRFLFIEFSIIPSMCLTHFLPIFLSVVVVVVFVVAEAVVLSGDGGEEGDEEGDAVDLVFSSSSSSSGTRAAKLCASMLSAPMPHRTGELNLHERFLTQTNVQLFVRLLLQSEKTWTSVLFDLDLNKCMTACSFGWVGLDCAGMVCAGFGKMDEVLDWVVGCPRTTCSFVAGLHNLQRESNLNLSS